MRRWRKALSQSLRQEARLAARERRFPALCIPGRSFLLPFRITRRTLLLRAHSQYVLAQVRRQLRQFGIAAELKGAQVGDHCPTVPRRDLRGIVKHHAEPVGDHVVDVTVGGLPQTVLVVGGRVLHAAYDHHAVPVSLQTVARRTENFVAVLAPLQELLVDRQWEVVRFFANKQFIIGYGTARDGILHELTRGTTVTKEIRR